MEVEMGSMKKITETIQRACCADSDLVPVRAKLSNSGMYPGKYDRIFKCRYCGDMWKLVNVYNGVDNDDDLVRWWPTSPGTPAGERIDG